MNKYKTYVKLVRQDGEQVIMQDERFLTAQEVVRLIAAYLGTHLPAQDFQLERSKEELAANPSSPTDKRGR